MKTNGMRGYCTNMKKLLVVLLHIPEMNGYRILARTCVLDGVRDGKGLGTGRRYIVEHLKFNKPNILFHLYRVVWCGDPRYVCNPATMKKQVPRG